MTALVAFIASFLGAAIFTIAGGVPFSTLTVLYINFLIQVPIAVALGFDKPLAGVMDHPPRPMTAPVLDRAQWLRIIFLGLLIAVATLVILDHFESRIGPAATATMALTVFGLCEVAMGISARSETGTVFDRDVMSGKQQLRLYGLSLLMIVLASELGVFQRMLDTTSLTGDQWLLCIGLALALLLIDELIKVVLRARAGRSADVTVASGRVAVATS